MRVDVRRLWRIGLAALVLAAAPACDDDDGDGNAADTGTGDTAGDTGGDTAADTGGDTAVDTGGDTEADTGGEDVTPDEGGDTGGETLRDFSVAMSGMTPHVGQLMEFRIVDNSLNALVARGFLDPLEGASATFELLNAVPEGSDLSLDFTADLNGDGSYDAPPADHAWSLPIPETGDVALTFDHTVDTLVDIGAVADTEGLDFSLAITELSPHVGQRLEVRVIAAEANQEVGRYVLGEVASADFTLEIPGILTEGVVYRVDFTADLNGNGSYDPPPADHAWRLAGTADGDGLALEFVHNTNFTDVGF